MELAWCPRDEALAPLGVVGLGAVAARLRTRALAEAALPWEGVRGEGLLALLGDAERLPWVDGVIYLGRDEAAPELLLPTTLKPSVPLPLLQRALLRQFPELAPPLGVVPGAVFSLATARPVDRGELERC